jgi:hypothetical protein
VARDPAIEGIGAGRRRERDAPMTPDRQMQLDAELIDRDGVPEEVVVRSCS